MYLYHLATVSYAIVTLLAHRIHFLGVAVIVVASSVEQKGRYSASFVVNPSTYKVSSKKEQMYFRHYVM